ncbi:MAG: hypothetical protein NTZ25_05660 [Candidatus Peregrinibacteria bacterium]|nr:hypothetical protein [Candidatus Peregrinibacteria bacterium]
MSEDFAGVEARSSGVEAVVTGFSSVLMDKSVAAVKDLDALQLYREARNFDSPDVLAAMEKLDNLVMRFLDQCKIPVVRPGPILSMKDGKLVMKGFLFSPEIIKAFNAIGPVVKLVVPKGNFLTEVHVNIDFLEMVLDGVTGEIRGAVNSELRDAVRNNV